MKKHYGIVMLMMSFATISRAQTTHYGEGAGIAGARGSYFGRYAGHALRINDPAGGNSNNSFFGDYCGQATTSNNNTGVGSKALFTNTTGSDNVAIGVSSLEKNTSGTANVGVGTKTLWDNTTGSGNTAIGVASLAQNTTGSKNTAVGGGALASNLTGQDNVAVGIEALLLSTGDFNTAIGSGALSSNLSTTNTAAGYLALNANGSGTLNTALGAYSQTYSSDGTLNSSLGYAAGPSSDGLINTTALGATARPTASNQVRIGNNSVISIGGRVAWSVISDGRFKRNVKEDVAGLEFINKLRPVSYYIDNVALDRFMGVPEAGTENMPPAGKAEREQGFIAQEVEAVVKKSGYAFSGIEAPQNDKDHYSIRYSDFVVPLVKAIQELALQVQQQQKMAQERQDEIAALKTQLAAGSTNSSDQ